MSSYVLDRDTLLATLCSSRIATAPAQPSPPAPVATNCIGASHWIDVNSNAALIGSYHRTANCNDAEVKKQITELCDQLKVLKNDLDRKDKLIAELSSFREIEKSKACECSKLDAIFHVDKTTAELHRKELASLNATLETTSNDLLEFKIKVKAKEEKISELKLAIETLKTENGSLNACVLSLRNKIRELENELGSFETVASKSGITIQSLQTDNSNLQKTVLELESRNKTLLSEKEETERKFISISNKLNELAACITSATGVDICGSGNALETMIKQFTETVTQSNAMKGRLMTTAEQMSSVEAENKANRDTINRLVAEVSKFEKEVTVTKTTMDKLKAERDSALTNKSVYEKEIETLKERITNIQTAWHASKTELDQKQAFITGQAANYKQLEYDALYAKNCLDAFKEQVATLLSDGFVKVEANEEQIKEKVKLLMTSSKDRGLMIASMEGKLQNLANQLTEQINLYKELEAKYHRTEACNIELTGKFKSLDNEYCANEVLRDNLKSDRIRYFSFLERLGCLLKINEISADIGLDMNIDLILARIEQLAKLECDSLADKQTNIYNLQRKVKSLKEQLDNKDLHLDLLRKKLCGLEEERTAKCALEKEVDEHVAMSKKFKIKVEKLTEQLASLRCENENLKAQLHDFNNCKNNRCDQEKEINKLCMRIAELESIKDKQSIKILKLKEELDSYCSDLSKTRSSSDNVVQSLSQELRTIKLELDKVQDREKQLIDFRCVIARMLGLDVNSLAVADYEIISRIERIVTSFNEGLVPVHSVANANLYQCIQPVAFDYSSSTSVNSSSDQKHHRHHHAHSHHENHHSQSPHRHHHHHRSSSGTRTEGSSSPSRCRSKSPRKVTIDPNSY